MFKVNIDISLKIGSRMQKDFGISFGFEVATNNKLFFSFQDSTTYIIVLTTNHNQHHVGSHK